MSDDPQAQRHWWLASDGKWYPPELHPDFGGQAREEDRNAALLSAAIGVERVRESVFASVRSRRPVAPPTGGGGAPGRFRSFPVPAPEPQQPEEIAGDEQAIEGPPADRGPVAERPDVVPEDLPRFKSEAVAPKVALPEAALPEAAVPEAVAPEAVAPAVGVVPTDEALATDTQPKAPGAPAFAVALHDERALPLHGRRRPARVRSSGALRDAVAEAVARAAAQGPLVPRAQDDGVPSDPYEELARLAAEEAIAEDVEAEAPPEGDGAEVAAADAPREEAGSAPADAGSRPDDDQVIAEAIAAYVSPTVSVEMRVTEEWQAGTGSAEEPGADAPVEVERDEGQLPAEPPTTEAQGELRVSRTAEDAERGEDEEASGVTPLPAEEEREQLPPADETEQDTDASLDSDLPTDLESAETDVVVTSAPAEVEAPVVAEDETARAEAVVESEEATVETGQDEVETGQDEVETGQDEVETGQDEVETGQEEVATEVEAETDLHVETTEPDEQVAAEETPDHPEEPDRPEEEAVTWPFGERRSAARQARKPLPAALQEAVAAGAAQDLGQRPSSAPGPEGAQPAAGASGASSPGTERGERAGAQPGILRRYGSAIVVVVLFVIAAGVTAGIAAFRGPVASLTPDQAAAAGAVLGTSEFPSSWKVSDPGNDPSSYGLGAALVTPATVRRFVASNRGCATAVVSLGSAMAPNVRDLTAVAYSKAGASGPHGVVLRIADSVALHRSAAPLRSSEQSMRSLLAQPYTQACVGRFLAGALQAGLPAGSSLSLAVAFSPGLPPLAGNPFGWSFALRGTELVHGTTVPVAFQFTSFCTGRVQVGLSSSALGAAQPSTLDASLLQTLAIRTHKIASSTTA